VKRAVRIFNEVIIAVAPSRKKKRFTLEERLNMITSAVKGIKEARLRRLMAPDRICQAEERDAFSRPESNFGF